MHNPIIEAVELAERFHDPDWICVDCRFELLAPDQGYAEYLAGHIPGARYAHLDRDLARAPRAGEGRHPLPEPDRFAERLSQWGIDRNATVVAYDAHGGAIAARLWWLLRWLRHDRVRVLNGGFGAWQRLGLPLETGVPAWQPRRYAGHAPQPGWVVPTDAVLALQAAGALVVDVRGAARYRGEQEPIDAVAGHVPGARNRPFADNLDSSGCFRDRAELRRELVELSEGREAEQIVAMCGSGVTACHLLLAMELAGLPGGRLFAGSWSEWIRDPARPIRVGAAP